MLDIENRLLAIETDCEYYRRRQLETADRLEWEADNYDYWDSHDDDFEEVVD